MNKRHRQGAAMVESLFFFLLLFWVLWAGVWLGRFFITRLALLDAVDVASQMAALREITLLTAHQEGRAIFEGHELGSLNLELETKRFLTLPAARFYRLFETQGSVPAFSVSGFQLGPSQWSERLVVLEEQ